jgi:hypothetical protein
LNQNITNQKKELYDEEKGFKIYMAIFVESTNNAMMLLQFKRTAAQTKTLIKPTMSAT